MCEVFDNEIIAGWVSGESQVYATFSPMTPVNDIQLHCDTIIDYVLGHINDMFYTITPSVW